MHRKKRIYKGWNKEYIEKLPLPLLEYKNDYIKKEIDIIDKLLKELNIHFDKKINNYKEKVKYIFNNRFSKIKRIIDEETNKYKFNELKELIDDLNNETNYNFTKLIVIEEYVNKLNEITDEMLPNKISFAFFDGDFYQSIYDSLLKVYPKLSYGAIVCFHDYERWNLKGVKLAVDDFFKNIGKNERTQFKICDQLGVYIHI